MGTKTVTKFPYDLEIGDFIKGVGEVVWIVNVAKHNTILNICEYETGNIKPMPFDNQKEVEVIG